MRRRSLISAKKENQWEDLNIDLSSFNSGNADIQINGNSLRVYYLSNRGSYRLKSQSFTTQSGYEYKITCDSITVTQGKASIKLRNASSVSVAGTNVYSTNQGQIEKIFQHNSTITMLSVFCTWDTSEYGDVTYENLKVYRRAL